MERPQGSLCHGDQFDREVEGGAAGDSGLGHAAVAVGKMGGDSQGPGLTLTHPWDATFVSLNDLKFD